jgi:pantoate--beta-alanine ligase
MSSRNVRLDKRSRAKAVEISKLLKGIKKQIASAKLEIKDIEQKAFDKLSSFSEFKVEYVAIRNAKTLKPIKTINDKTQLVALVAAWIGGVRLIDNMLL